MSDNNLVEPKDTPQEKHSAFPLAISKDQQYILGLTKLEYMAAIIASGMEANGNCEIGHKDVAKYAVLQAKVILRLANE